MGFEGSNRRKEGEMRRWYGIGVALLVILGGIAIGVGAYNAGIHEGLERSGDAAEVVRYVGPGFGFPFGLVLFPLFFFGIFALMRGAFWRRGWDGHGHGPSGPGPWGKGGPPAFEEWHRRQHERSPEQTSAGGEPVAG
jgi:hypothetical protein